MSNYENGPEEIKRIPRMPDAVLECIIQHSLFKNLANRYEGEDRNRLHGLMHDTAEEVLARVSLATPSPANGADPDDMAASYDHSTDDKRMEVLKGLRDGAVGEMPKPALRTDMHIDGKGVPAYSADQLRAAVLAERACIIQFCEEEAARWKYPSHGYAAVNMLQSLIRART